MYVLVHVEPPMDVSGPTMTCLRGQEGSLIGQLYRKRFFGYSDYTYAFSPSNCHLYQFRNELVSLICPARPFIPKGDWEDGREGGLPYIQMEGSRWQGCIIRMS